MLYNLAAIDGGQPVAAICSALIRHLESAARQMLRRVGLEGAEKSPVSALTYIDQKRLELARASRCRFHRPIPCSPVAVPPSANACSAIRSLSFRTSSNSSRSPGMIGNTT